MLMVIFTSIACLSLAYYFQEVLRKKKLTFPGLSKFKWFFFKNFWNVFKFYQKLKRPFVITSLAFTGIYIFLIYKATNNTSNRTFVHMANYLAATLYLLVDIFFLFGGIRVAMNLKKFKNSKLFKFIVLLVISFFGILLLVISSYIFGAIAGTATLNSFIALRTLLVIGALLFSCPSILTFMNPEETQRFIKTSKTQTSNRKKSESSFKSDPKNSGNSIEISNNTNNSTN